MKAIAPAAKIVSFQTRLLACSALGVGLYIVASTIWMVVMCWYPLPYDDQWAQLVSGRDIDWAWLVSQHNEHRILFPRLVFILDYWLADERNIVDVATSLLIQAGLSVLLVRLADSAWSRQRFQLAWVSGVVVAFLFWAAQWDNFTWGFQVQFLGEMLAATGTFAMLALGRPTLRLLGAVVVLELVSVYTLSSGIAVPFLTVALAIRLRRSRLHIGLLSVSAVALTASYLAGYHTPSPAPNLHDIAPDLGNILKHMAVELGGPIAESLHWWFRIDDIAIAAAAGATGISAFVILAARRWRHLNSREAVLFTLGCFLLAMMCLTGIGRVTMGLDQAMAVRYATPAGLFWLTILLLVAMRHPSAGMLLAVPALLLIGSSQPRFVSVAKAVTSGRAMAAPAMLANVDDAFTLKNLHTNPHFILGKRAVLMAGHGSVFADDWSDWAGTPLATHVAVSDAAKCRGGFDMVRAVSDATNPGWRGVGRLHPIHGRHGRDRLVLVDKGGIVVGYGLAGFSAGDVGDATTAADEGLVWWIGAFTGATSEQVVAYVLLDATTACPLGEAPPPGLPPTVKITDTHPADLPDGGMMNAVESRQKYVVEGWAMIQQARGAARVTIDTNLPIKSSALTVTPRPDVVAALQDPGLLDSGFTITFDLDEPAPKPDKVRLCLWTDDAVYGRHLIRYAVQPDLCAP